MDGSCRQGMQYIATQDNSCYTSEEGYQGSTGKAPKPVYCQGGVYQSALETAFLSCSYPLLAPWRKPAHFMLRFPPQLGPINSTVAPFSLASTVTMGVIHISKEKIKFNSLLFSLTFCVTPFPISKHDTSFLNSFHCWSMLHLRYFCHLSAKCLSSSMFV